MAASICARALRQARSAWASSSAITTSTSTGTFRRVAGPSATRSTIRWASTHAKIAEDEDVHPLDTSVPASSVEQPTAAHSDQPEFSSLHGAVSDQTLKAITVKPFKLKHMSPVQAAVLPLLPGLAEPYKGAETDETEQPARDLLVRARTGTGKTLAFLIPALEARVRAIEAHAQKAMADAGLVNDRRLEAQSKRLYTRETVGTLIISPTRELATQIANEAIRLSHHHEAMEVRLLTGGNSKRQQMNDWFRGRKDVVVGTPGRLRDLLTTEPDIAKAMARTQVLILDEADTLLDMGFKDDIDAITEFLLPSPERQTFLFSATVSPQIRQIARRTLAKNHLYINCVDDNAAPVNINIPQYHTVLPSAADQLPHVLRLIAHDQLSNPGKAKSVVFLPTTKMTQLYATFLRKLAKTLPLGGQASKIYEMHSKLHQTTRQRTSDMFKRDASGGAILVTSDVSARGVDYPGVTRVIQVGIPGGSDQYIHRVGRTGRGDITTGRADLVLLPWEIGFVTWQLTNIPLKPLTTNQLISELEELTAKFDADPSAFWAAAGLREPQPSRGFRDNARPAPIQAPYAPLLAAMPETLQDMLTNVDEQAIEETVVSLLGYYFGKSGELRVQKTVILEGVKDWSVQAGGLATPPFLSQTFLDRIGLSDGRTGKNYGKPRQSSPSLNNNSWERRGSKKTWEHQAQRSEHGERRRNDWGTRDPRDPNVDPEEYTGSHQRYQRGGDRDSRQGGGRNFERGGGRNFERGGGRSFERTGGRNFERGGDRGYQRGGDRQQE